MVGYTQKEGGVVDVDSLSKLEALTKELTLGRLSQKKGTAWVEYEVTDGYCLGIGLYHNAESAVQRSIMTAGTVFPRHWHLDATEILIITHGTLEIREDNKEPFTIGVGELHQFAKGIPHSVVALEDTRLLGITVPAGDGYPDAP